VVAAAPHPAAGVSRQAASAGQAEKVRFLVGSARPRVALVRFRVEPAQRPVASAAFLADSVRFRVAKAACLVALVPRAMGRAALSGMRAPCYPTASQAAAPRCVVGRPELLLRVALP
jgi:hypothetical protein